MMSLKLFLAFSTILSVASAYSVSPNTTPQQKDIGVSGRRTFLQQTSLVFGSVATLSVSPAYAAEVIVLPTKEAVTSTFGEVRYELENSEGGVAYMQDRIDNQDWIGLMEFTKTYDLELRKLRMRRAKKLLQSKGMKEKGTEFSNAVTFDLIGINRNSRSGQENVEGANKYLQELRDDVDKFLELEGSIQTEE